MEHLMCPAPDVLYTATSKRKFKAYNSLVTSPSLSFLASSPFAFLLPHFVFFMVVLPLPPTTIIALDHAVTEEEEEEEEEGRGGGQEGEGEER
jgi:hypothetical protein